jgi:hypothetical protein
METKPSADQPLEVDYSKLDGPLTAALEEQPDLDEAALDVFLTLDLARQEGREALLTRIGHADTEDTTGPLTATLSPRALREISRDPSVAYIQLSRTRRPLPR